MNCIQTLIDRQLGNYCRFNYDDILRRLEVHADESFYGLQRGWAAGSAGVALDTPDPPIFACRFAESAGYEHMLALANEDGRVAIQNTCNPATARELEGFQCHNNAVFDLAWMPASMNFVTVSGDHTACLWDVGSGGPREVSVFSGHSRSVKTVAFRPGGGGVFATGARDGHVLLWDARAAPRPIAAVLRAGAPSAEPPAPPVLRPDDTLASCHARCAPRTPGSAGKRARHEPRPVSITGLVFQDERALLSCGECDGNIKLWDLRKTYGAGRREPLARRALPYPGASAKRGYTHLLLDAARVRLYASCMDDVIYCFNVATYSAAPERRYRGHENATFYIKTSLSPDGAYLVSGSSDKRAYVWNVASAEPVARLAGHRAEVTCAAWARRGDPKIVTCGDDARHMIWRIGRELCEGEAERRAGRAERAPAPPEPHARPVWGSQERTPTSLKRRAGTPASRDAKRARAPPPSTRRTKRCLADLMNAARDEEDASAKRPRLEEERLLPAGSKRRISECATSAEAGPSAVTDGRYIVAPADWGYISPPAGASFMTPTKNHSAVACRVLSPRPLPLFPNRRADSPDPPESAGRMLTFGTPTKDLPDFVRSGEAPHLRLMSPERRRPERHNWLTRLARERRGKLEDGPAAVETVTHKLFSPCSPKENVPLRRNSASERTPRAKKPRTLLKYFPVARKE